MESLKNGKLVFAGCQHIFCWSEVIGFNELETASQSQISGLQRPAVKTGKRARDRMGYRVSSCGMIGKRCDKIRPIRVTLTELRDKEEFLLGQKT